MSSTSIKLAPRNLPSAFSITSNPRLGSNSSVACTVAILVPASAVVDSTPGRVLRAAWTLLVQDIGQVMPGILNATVWVAPVLLFAALLVTALLVSTVSVAVLPQPTKTQAIANPVRVLCIEQFLELRKKTSDHINLQRSSRVSQKNLR